jgi:hypothetical protein
MIRPRAHRCMLCMRYRHMVQHTVRRASNISSAIPSRVERSTRGHTIPVCERRLHRGLLHHGRRWSLDAVRHVYAHSHSTWRAHPWIHMLGPTWHVRRSMPKSRATHMAYVWHHWTAHMHLVCHCWRHGMVHVVPVHPAWLL